MVAIKVLKAVPTIQGVADAPNDTLQIFKNDSAFIIKMKKKYGSRFSRYPNYEKSHIKWLTNPLKEDNVPYICSSIEEMYDRMKYLVSEDNEEITYVYNFVLGMLSEDGKYEVWKRDRQPCQGGEMRKYGCTHDDCTRPDDPRPGDLYYPFPDGTPLALATKFKTPVPSKVYNKVFSPESVFRRAYGNEDNISLVKSCGKFPGSACGLLVKDASLIDPTVFVFMAKYLKNDDGPCANFLDHECMTVPEKIAFRVAGYYSLESLTGSFNDQKDYIGGKGHFNINRVLKGGIEATQDLTGGPLGSRYDYNRPEITEIFKGGEKISYLPYLVNKAGGRKVRTFSDLPHFMNEFRAVCQEL